MSGVRWIGMPHGYSTIGWKKPHIEALRQRIHDRDLARLAVELGLV